MQRKNDRIETQQIIAATWPRLSQWDIADELQIDQSTVSRDIKCLRQKKNLQRYIQQKPQKIECCLTG